MARDPMDLEAQVAAKVYGQKPKPPKTAGSPQKPRPPRPAGTAPVGAPIGMGAKVKMPKQAKIPGMTRKNRGPF